MRFNVFVSSSTMSISGKSSILKQLCQASIKFLVCLSLTSFQSSMKLSPTFSFCPVSGSPLLLYKRVRIELMNSLSLAIVCVISLIWLSCFSIAFRYCLFVEILLMIIGDSISKKGIAFALYSFL